MLQRWDGVWAPPGGFVEPGETPLEGAVREAFEECGLAPMEPFALHDFAFDTDPPLHVYQYISRAPAGEVVLSPEHQAAHWFLIDEYVARQLHVPDGVELPDSSRQWVAAMSAVAAKAQAWVDGNGPASE
jgi:ADP-ribose pyrophosphatase YjhB (NUDIX family)